MTSVAAVSGVAAGQLSAADVRGLLARLEDLSVRVSAFEQVFAALARAAESGGVPALLDAGVGVDPLWVQSGEMPSQPPKFALYNLRDARGETQDDVAQGLMALAFKQGSTAEISANHISRWERGVVRPGRFYTRLLSQYFGVSPAELGLVRPRLDEVATRRPGGVR